MKKNIESLLDEALRTEPTFQLRKDFKDKVVVAIRKKEKKHQRKLYFWMAFGTVIMLGFGFGILALFLPATLQSLGNIDGVNNQVIPAAILIGVAVGIIQYLDKRLVKDKVLHL